MKKYTIPSIRLLGGSFSVFVFALFLSGCKTESVSTNTSDPAPINSPIPKTPGTIIVPADNPLTSAKIELGRHLFFDKNLSVDKTTSCSSCHDPSAGFSDERGLSTSMGFAHRMGTRNAPGLANVGYRTVITWDGKFSTLENHASAPMFNSIEMGNNFSSTGFDTVTTGYYQFQIGQNDTNFLFKRLNGRSPDRDSKNYSELLIAAWGDSKFTMDRITKSIASFERTFISTGSTFDRYNNGDLTAYKYNPEALHGFQLFTDPMKGNCVSCHSGYDFTDEKFHNNGIGSVVNSISGKIDSGRIGISKDPFDAFKFRTPSLRNVALTGPYMHDGRFKHLEDVMAMYRNGGGSAVPNKDINIRPLKLTDQDVSDIIEFLKTLSDNNFVSDKANRYANPWED